LKDFLPLQIPNARIMAYGYDSAVVLSKNNADIGDFADQLLLDLETERLTSSAKSRPIIFICHSLGGLVFKKVRTYPFPALNLLRLIQLKALVRANEQKRNKDLLERVRGVAFFATPHQGSSMADWLQTFSRVLDSASLANGNLITALKSNAVTLGDLGSSWVERASNLERILSFFELERMPGMNSRVRTPSFTSDRVLINLYLPR
jgi:hypothetical protein